MIVNLVFIEDYGTIVAALSTLASFSIMSLLVHIKCFEYYKLNYLVEIRDYLLISILGLIVYSLYFNLDIPITFDSISLKFITLILCVMIAFKIYRKSNSNILSNKND